MAQRLKSWESPRRKGRNSKGKGGSARQRQLKKQRQMLRKKLKGQTPNRNQNQKQNQKQKEKGTEVLFSFYLSKLPISPSPRLRVSASPRLRVSASPLNPPPLTSLFPLVSTFLRVHGGLDGAQ